MKIRQAYIVTALAFCAGALLAVSDAGVRASGNFGPTGTFTLSSNAAGANADSTSTVSMPAGTMLGGATLLTPPAACVAAGPDAAGGDCGTAKPIVGDILGSATATVTLGLGNGPCNFPIGVTLTLINATIDNSAANEIAPSGTGEADAGGALSPLLHDVNSVSTPPANGDGGSAPPSAISPANGLPGHVDRYPKYLNSVYDPDGAGAAPPLVPLARYSGGTTVFGQTVIIEVGVFAPGALAAYVPPHPLSDLAAPSLGYASIPVLNDPTADPAPGGTITSLCTPNSTTTTAYGIAKTNPCNGNTLPPCNSDSGINSPVAGVATGRARYANPSTAGTHFFSAVFTSARDSDNDGIENPLDTCPYTATPGYTPTAADAANDSDSDMLPGGGPAGGCDPTPATNTNSGDHDLDGFVNAADNCPLVANPTNSEAEEDAADSVSRPRGGSSTDGLGDECDAAETACSDALDNEIADSGPDGLINDGCPAVGSTAGEIVCTNAQPDDDGDGAPNDGCPATGAGETLCDDANDNDADTLVNDGCRARATAVPEAQCSDTGDNDSDGRVNDGCPAVAGPETDLQCLDAIDDDLDGFTNDGCPAVADGAPEAIVLCGTAVDDDGDGVVNDGCPADGPMNPETGSDCGDGDYRSQDDDNGDGATTSTDDLNDGCPVFGTTSESGCLNAFDDDADTVVNDGCASSAMVANGHFHTIARLVPVCIGGTDVDGDGWCAAPLAVTDPISDPVDANAAVGPENYALVRYFPVAHSSSGSNPPSSREPLQVCNDGIDNDGDTMIDLLEGDGLDSNTLSDCNPKSVTFAATDVDGDGYSDATEIYVGTDPLGRCERTGTAASQSRDWPADHVGSATSGDKLTLTDISVYTASPKRFNTKPGDANFLQRYDIVPGTTTAPGTNWITLVDLSDVAFTRPPMFEGIRAFAGPRCAAHPTLND